MLFKCLDIIRSPLSTITLHITELILNDIARLPEANVIALTALCNVKSVSLNDNVMWARLSYQPRLPHNGVSLPPPDYIRTFLGRFSNLKRLKLSYIQVKSFAQLCDIICANDKLEVLFIQKISLVATESLTRDEILRTLPSYPITLLSFETGYSVIENQIYELMYLWLAQSQPMIDALDIFDWANDSDSIPSLLRSVGIYLEYLTVTHVRRRNDGKFIRNNIATIKG